MIRWFRKIERGGLLLQSAVLLVATGGMLAVATFFWWWLGGGTDVVAALIASGLCLSGVLVSLSVCHLGRDSELALYCWLVGMVPRMGIPLVGGLALTYQVPSLAGGEILLYALAFYPVLLGIETILSLPLAYPSPSEPSPNHTGDQRCSDAPHELGNR